MSEKKEFNNDRKNIVSVIRRIDKLMWADDPDGIDKEISALDVSTSSPSVMIATLRTPWLFKDRLKAWVPKLIEINDELIKRNLDVGEVLLNLLDYLPESCQTDEEERN